MYQSTYGYDSISTPSKENKGNLARGLFWGFSAAILSLLSIYFIYSGYFGIETPLTTFFVSTEPTQHVRIEYNMDDERAIDLVPDTEEWMAFHDALITEAGYNAEALRTNPKATVTFVAYDAIEDEADIVADEQQEEEVEEEIRKKGSGNYYRQNRPTYGISCYTEYTEVGTTNSQTCSPTAQISNPIRTGCSSLGSDNLVGVSPVNDLECASDSADVRVSARCCQPTPTTKYESSAWTMAMREKNEEANCLDIGCHDGEVLVGCTGSIPDSNVFGGVKMFKNECSVQKDNEEGEMIATAMCAKQASTCDYTLQCEAVNAEGSTKMRRRAEFGYESAVQCPVDYVMFDCNSYLDERIAECSAPCDDAESGELSGEYYYKKATRSKTECKAVGSSDKIRAQAICCGLF